MWIIPADNVSDLADVDEVVKKSIDFHPVRKLDEVSEIALTEKPQPSKPICSQEESSPSSSPASPENTAASAIRRKRKRGNQMVKFEAAAFEVPLPEN